ncbi:MAG: OmpH family outer membrane protein [Candidatus Omnitrophica bacterium]|nr:OmpH family outer membrane protein [Candidatus Omnitrophota bacterium]MBU1868928.1 OmpH family outer membrane protein [Candidatus Omnitrophota bacterium]
MKRAAIVLFGVIFGLTIAGRCAFAADKLAYVDLSRLFSEYGKTKDYDKTLSDKEGSYVSERDKKINDIKSFQDKLNIMSDQQKETKKSELETKIKSLQNFQNQKETDLRKEQDEKLKEIMKDIEEAVKKFSEKEGYTLVFNDRVLIYQTKSYDITEKVLDILNKGYKK